MPAPRRGSAGALALPPRARRLRERPWSLDRTTFHGVEFIVHPLWLIEAGVYGAEADPLLAEIRRQGMAAEVVPYRALSKGPVPLAGPACVIGYGTFPFARQIQLHHRAWVPGAWADPDNLDCATYYAHFGAFLLNQRHAILPGVEAIRQRDRLLSAFAGEDGNVFVRPTGCGKLFVGRRVAADQFAAALAPARYDPATLVVVAPVKPIAREWRLVVAGDRVIAGSQYAAGGARSITPDCPAEVRAFAESMLAQVRWRPDPIFMLDVGESAGRLRLIELNGFSCSWLYRCDLAAVVAAAGELAGRAWAEGGSAEPEMPAGPAASAR